MGARSMAREICQKQRDGGIKFLLNLFIEKTRSYLLVFLFQHGIFMFSIGRDSSVACQLLQNDTCEMSFRQRSFLLRRGIFYLFQHGIFMFSIGRDSSVAEKLLQNDMFELSRWLQLDLIIQDGG